MTDEARKRYNEFKYRTRKIEDVADETQELVDEDRTPGFAASLETIASTAQMLRTVAAPEHFEDDSD